MARLCVALVPFLCLAATAGAVKTHMSSGELAPVNPMETMQALFSELQTQADAGVNYSRQIAGWCHDAKANKAAYVLVLQRQAEAASSAAKQHSLEEQRLNNEQRLLQFTISQKQQQLSEAETTKGFASSEFEEEQQEMNDMLDATKHAINLANGNDTSKESMYNSLAQVPMDQMTKDERFATSSFLHGLGSSTTEVDTEDLSTMLNQIQLRLASERVQSIQEHQIALKKFKTFASNLNSSILQSQSQTAAIAVEISQRRRERARLSGRASDLSALLAAVQAGVNVADNVCSEERARVKELADFIAAESESVNVMLKQLPRFGSASYDHGTLEDAEGAGTAAPYSFLQEAEHVVKAKAQKAESEDLVDVGGNSTSDHGTSNQSVMQELQSFVKLDIPTLADKGDTGNLAMQDLRKFVGSAAKGAGKSAAASGNVNEQLHLMLNTFQQERDRATQRLAKRQNSCTLLLKEGSKDSAALTRSGQRRAAEVKINQETLAEYAETAAYNVKQKRLMDALLERLTVLVDNLQQETERSLSALKVHSAHVLSAASELSQQLDVENRGADGAARVLQGLASRLDSHQDALEQHSVHLSQVRMDVEAADQKVAQHLDRNMDADRNRLMRLKYQGRFLTSLAQARQRDIELSRRFEELSSNLCSQENIARLGEGLANNTNSHTASTGTSSNLRAGRRVAPAAM